MAGRLLLTSQIELQIPGEPPVELGPRGQTYGVNISGLFDTWRGSIANNTTVTIWDATASSIASFEFAWFKADQAILLEFIGTATADNHDIKLRAGVPFVLTTDDTLGYNAAGGFAGSAQVVKIIKARNTSGSTATLSAYVIL